MLELLKGILSDNNKLFSVCLSVVVFMLFFVSVPAGNLDSFKFILTALISFIGGVAVGKLPSSEGK